MKTLYTNAVVLDGTRDMTPRRGLQVLVENGLIAAIIPADTASPSLQGTDCEVLDLEGRFLMPGLINLHVHLNSGGIPSRRKKKPGDYVRLVRLATSTPLTRALLRRRIRDLAAQQLQSGVTTIRTVGGIADFDAQLRDRTARLMNLSNRPANLMVRAPASTRSVRSGQPLCPSILAGNTGISVPGGHVAGSLAYPVSSPEEAEACVDLIAKTRPDLIKLMVTGGIMDAEKEGEPGVLKMSPDIIQAACARAHALGFPVAAHTESTEGVIAALRGGVDTIEHGAQPTDEMMALFRERKASLVTTISPVLPLARLDTGLTHVRPMDRNNAEIVLQGIIACARRALEEGIPVGLGTDSGCPFVTQYDTWRELLYFQHFCGVSASFALHTATLVNAEIAGIAQRTGSIEAGKDADLLITDFNPLDDLRSLRTPYMVVSKGVRIQHPALRKNLSIEKILDSLL